jgi:hypothetical protein
MASPNCKTEAEDSDRHDAGITNRSSAVKFPRFTIIHTARVTMQKHEFSPGRAHSTCYWIFHTISVTTPQQQNSKYSLDQEKKKERNTSNTLEDSWNDVTKLYNRSRGLQLDENRCQSLRVQLQTSANTCISYLGPRHRPQVRGDDDKGFLICHTQDATTKKMTNSMEEWYRHA